MNPTATEAPTIVVPTQAPAESPMATPFVTPDASVFTPVMQNSATDIQSPSIPVLDSALPVQQPLQTETMPVSAPMSVSPDLGTPTTSFPQAVDTNPVPSPVNTQPDNGLSAIPTERTDGYVTPNTSAGSVSLSPTASEAAVPAPMPEWKPPASITADVTSATMPEATKLSAMSSQDSALPLNDPTVNTTQGVDTLSSMTGVNTVSEMVSGSNLINDDKQGDDSGHITTMISQELAENEKKAAQLAADKEEGQRLLEFHNSDLGRKYRETLRKAGWKSRGDIVESTGSNNTQQGSEPASMPMPAPQSQAA